MRKVTYGADGSTSVLAPIVGASLAVFVAGSLVLFTLFAQRVGFDLDLGIGVRPNAPAAVAQPLILPNPPRLVAQAPEPTERALVAGTLDTSSSETPEARPKDGKRSGSDRGPAGGDAPAIATDPTIGRIGVVTSINPPVVDPYCGEESYEDRGDDDCEHSDREPEDRPDEETDDGPPYGKAKGHDKKDSDDDADGTEEASEDEPAADDEKPGNDEESGDDEESQAGDSGDEADDSAEENGKENESQDGESSGEAANPPDETADPVQSQDEDD